MAEVPVCIIGCGPIGLTGALLLSRHGVPSLLVERRSELNNHPRSRFVDTNTMELFREFGIEKAVEATGLGPAWTAYNRWSDTLADEPYANIPSPTFLSVPGPNSPCIPVMTVQDEVEAALMTRVVEDPMITVRFDTEAIDLAQTDDATQLTLRDTRTDERQPVTAQYTIGADGPGSGTREVIGTHLEAEPRPIHSQDVIFHADLDAYVGERKGSLLYTTNPKGLVIFQALDGRRRWRCQIVVGDENLISEEAVSDRIRAALGTEDDVGFEIISMRMWQPTPGCVTRFSQGRIFLAGDAAHVSVPTGGMGNNTGFAGIRNLAWKLAYVVRGLAPESILETYEAEHRPIAVERIDWGVSTTDYMGLMMAGRRRGEDITEHIQATHQYADYDHLLLGFEMSSDLIAPNAEPAPQLEDPKTGFTPLVRSGRRAPHVWVDADQSESVLDWYGSSYVLLVGAECSLTASQAALADLPSGGVPVAVRQLPAGISSGPYEADAWVLVRPDGIIACHGTDSGGSPDPSELPAYLPNRTG
ncbi:FAD-dependent monooxygenase [Candidatus Poriferisocius sp.]|uniref:FAD-dependent monooxygenase n=1 Tax=Candidatus Poriferisocius sp. TaxID=3101276 RepID=UPI003B52C36F